MSLVLDPSPALAWYFEDERTPKADALRERGVEQGAVVPTLWRLEIANGFQVAIRRGRIDAAFRDVVLEKLAGLPIATDPETGALAWSAQYVSPTASG